MTSTATGTGLMLAAAVGCGLVGGLFFAFSSFVMRAFDRLPAPQAIAAMQSINVTVLNPLFFLVFFGTMIIALALALVAAFDWSNPASPFIVSGATTYLLGCIVVTIRFNVPLNNVLAGIRPSDDGSDEVWIQYRRPWTRWNHVRTVASLVSSAAFGIALVLARGMG